MSSLVVTAGFGNGTLTGSIAKVVTRGYAIAEEAAITIQGVRMKPSPIQRIMTPTPVKRIMVINRA